MTVKAISERPSDDELDLFGVTHKGNVRAENQDHFLISTVHPQVVVHATSLPSIDDLPLRGTRLATMMVLADGVGGATAGSEAARLATESVTRYVACTLRSYHAAGDGSDQELLEALKAASFEAHEAVRTEAARRGRERMATTLTLCMAIWPWAYITQVGDSRGYLYQKGELKQITRDQTVAQALIDEGAAGVEQMERSPLKNVLSSAIGADEALPVVTRFNISDRGSLILLCSDGLTKHVTNSEIADVSSKMTSSEELVTTLLDLALSRGGMDNITIAAARAPVKSYSGSSASSE